jgi:hypothetical protein
MARQMPGESFVNVFLDADEQLASHPYLTDLIVL